jgi:hypothetical protein
MLTQEIIHKILNDTEYNILAQYCDKNKICNLNRKELINFLKSTNFRNTVNDKLFNNSDLESSNLSNNSNTIPVRPRLAVSHTICINY